MKYEILYQPSFSVVRMMLESGESIRAESGAMVSMTANMHLESKGQGGLGKMLGRLVAGESMFQSTFTAQNGPGEVIFAPSSPGDIYALDVSGQPMMVTSGCYLAGDTRLDMQTVGNMKNFFGGESIFMLRIFGQGLLLVSSFGAIHAVQLQAGQQYIVDTGHLVAFSEGMGYNLRKAARGIMGSITSGEGIVAEMTGPGVVYIQTRTPQGFGSWLSPFVSRG